MGYVGGMALGSEVRGRQSLAWSVATTLLAGSLMGCAAKAPPGPSGEPAAPRDLAEDRLVVAARTLLREGCDQGGAGAGPGLSIPRWRTGPLAPGGASEGAPPGPPFDVVIYTAHPDDEAMYAGGTMDRLVRAGRRVAFVPMSHGEGGRLLERGPDGGVEERRDYPRAHVVSVRDREIAAAAGRIKVSYSHLYPAEANVDDAWTTSCDETLSRWDASLPDGIAGVLARLVADIRAKRPRVVITLDPRDDPQASRHGHHKAAGVVTDAAARLSADPSVRAGGDVHVVEELLTAAPRDLPGDVSVEVDVGARIAMLEAYGSQFVSEQLAGDPIAQRPVERFVLRWRAGGAPAPAGGTRLGDLVAEAPGVP
jgi:LmbE family N-acetylglucosaminyl deacetylase